MRLCTLASARAAPANSRTKGSVYKTRLSRAPCHVYFCLSVMFVYPPLERFFLFGAYFMELLVCSFYGVFCQDQLNLVKVLGR